MKDHDDNLQPESIDEVIEDTGSLLSDPHTAGLLQQMQAISQSDARANSQSLDRIWHRLQASHEHTFASSSQIPWIHTTEQTRPHKDAIEKERTTMQINDRTRDIPVSRSSSTPKRQSRWRVIDVVTMIAITILFIGGFLLLSGRLQPFHQASRSTTVGSVSQPQTGKASSQVCQIRNDPATRNSALWPPMLSWSTQGQIAYTTQTTLKVVSAQNCATLFSHPAQDATYPLWSPDGKEIAVTANDGLSIFDNKGNTLTHLSYAQLNANQASESVGIRIISWSSDGQQLFFASSDASYRGHIESLNIVQGNKITELTTLPIDTTLDQISPNLQFALLINRNTTNDDKTLELWNIAKGQKIEAFPSNPNSNGPDTLAMNNTSLVRVDGDNLVQIYRLSDGALVNSFHLSYVDFEPALWSPDGRFITAGNQNVTTYEVSTGKAVTTVVKTSHGQQILSVAWSPDSEEMATITGPSSPKDSSAATFAIWKL